MLPAAFAAGALAQSSYPSRPIRILVGFAPGGAADITARVIGEKFTQSMGANVVVDNRTGATGIIATDIVAKSAPDGYTLGVFALSFAINPSIRKLPYDTERDFTPITITATVPLVLVVTNSLPAKSVKELTAGELGELIAVTRVELAERIGRQRADGKAIPAQIAKELDT